MSRGAIPVVAQWQPEFRPFRVAQTRAGYAISAPRRYVAVVDPLLTPSAVLDVGRLAKFEELDDVAGHPGHDLIAVATPEGAAVLDPTGTVLERHTRPTLAVAWAGETLWSVERLPDGGLGVRVWDAGFEDCLARLDLADDLGESAVHLVRAPAGTWLMTLLAGQDGAETSLLRRDGGTVTHTRLPALDDCAPADFTPDASALLTQHDPTEELRLYSWPALAPLGRYQRPDGTASGYANLVIDPATAIADGDGRRWLLDLETMTPRRELLIAGHDLRPTSEIYTGLNDSTPTTDVVTVHHAAPGQLIATTYRGLGAPGEVLLVDVSRA